MDALSSLKEIDGDLFIDDNRSLLDIDGLSNLERVEGYIYIVGNDGLTNIDGLSSLSYGGQDLSIVYNESLCQDDVDALVEEIEIEGEIDTCCNLEDCE